MKPCDINVVAPNSIIPEKRRSFLEDRELNKSLARNYTHQMHVLEW